LKTTFNPELDTEDDTVTVPWKLALAVSVRVATPVALPVGLTLVALRAIVNAGASAVTA